MGLKIINHAPEIISSDTLYVIPLNTLEYHPEASDHEQNPVTYTFEDYPTWLRCSKNVISGTAPSDFKAGSFTVIATDGNMSDTMTVYLKLDPNTDISTPDELLPDAYRLHPVHPNPFNPVTTIQLDLPTPNRADLRIYNIHGELVETLQKGVLDAGSHQFRWDASAFPSGTYIIIANTDNFRDTQRCILIK